MGGEGKKRKFDRKSEISLSLRMYINKNNNNKLAFCESFREIRTLNKKKKIDRNEHPGIGKGKRKGEREGKGEESEKEA